ncbi:MAG: hypothetical protein Q7T76_19495 [Ferruginibacter sp.]|nr:hypothetical protein [Ferruginibacter sp.]
MKSIILVFILVTAISTTGCSQQGAVTPAKEASMIKVGDDCEGCEAVYETPVPFEMLSSSLTLPGFEGNGPKIEISGTVYQRDGRTPATGVTFYVYHTDQTGVYATKGNETGWGRRHGYIRGWLKTDERGAYKILTLVPASYPNSNNPKHIHPTIKEPGKTAYWIDEFVFADDPYLSGAEKDRKHPRGGSGILTPVKKDGLLRATRNITLGLNVPNYPVATISNPRDNKLAGTTDSPELTPYFYPGLVRESTYLSSFSTDQQVAEH